HVAIRVALKCEIPVINVGDPDPTLTETGIPWVIRVISDDRQSSYALANRIYNEDGYSRVSVLRTNSRYGRVGTGEFKDASRRMGNPVAVEIRFEEGNTDFTDQLSKIKTNNSDAIVLWGDAKELGMIVNQMRAMGLEHPVYACDRVVSPEFLEIAGDNANGIITTSQYNPKANNSRYKSFQKAYKERFQMEPDVFAAHTYDGAKIAIEAIQKAGLNRTLIRDLITDNSTFQNYQGVTGEIVFDGSWNDVGQIFMVEIKDDDFIFSPFIMNDQVLTGSNKEKTMEAPICNIPNIKKTSAYKLVGKQSSTHQTIIDVGGVRIGGKELVVMAGPCAVESKEQLLSTARIVSKFGAQILRGGAFKPRSSPYSFQGLEEEGLLLLQLARLETGLPIVTEVMDTRRVVLVGEYADILQVGSRNMSNFPLLKEVGLSKKPILLKRGMNATIEEFLLAAEYILSQGNDQVILCERGIRTFETAYRN
ncbi:MAG: ABC transporter substrate-binding protein, partial [Cyclobacteriaceae bacterium]|nr:ABC transporter substrate-binding protein [Cyclobacteriaceae bacterium]